MRTFLLLLLAPVTFAGVLGPFPSPATMKVGETKTFCLYFRFSNNHVAMRARDAPACQADFVARYSKTRRYISRRNQAWTDTRCITWSVSNPKVARVTQETCTL